MLIGIDITVAAGEVTGSENMKEDVPFSGLEGDGSGCSIHGIRLKAEGY
jgi:hypothetical protein